MMCKQRDFVIIIMTISLGRQVICPDNIVLFVYLFLK